MGIPSNLILAVVLLQPSELVMPSVEESIQLQQYRYLKYDLRFVAISLEILDKQEEAFYFHKEEDFVSDLYLLKRRHSELLNAPYIEDRHLFPSRDEINYLLPINRGYYDFVKSLKETYPSHWYEIDQVLHEVDEIYRVYDLVRDIQCPYYYITTRRKSLLTLREKLGPDYYLGILPDILPVHRLVRID